MNKPQLAIIGGTGVYDIEALTDVEPLDVDTPFGAPSDTIQVGTLEGLRVAFLARHGRGHRHLPSEVPYRANIWALKSLGVERIIAVSACGSLKESYEPGHIVIPDQLFDRTKARPSTFFGKGLTAHISFAEPFCPTLSRLLSDAVREAGGTVHDGGIYLIIEGPRFSSRGESLIYRQWGCGIIGMTAAPEAQLAREAEICYAVMAHVTDYDSWHEEEEAVSVEMVVRTLARNTELAKQALRHLARRIGSHRPDRDCPCRNALATAILTPKEALTIETRERLWPILQKYL